MAKRQLRINQQQIATKIDLLIGKTVSVILKNNSVLFVQCIKFENDIFVTKDMIRRVHNLRLDDIREIILETHA